MDLSFTQNIKSIEDYSLSLIDFFEELPDSVFDDERLSPSKQVLENVIRQTRGADLTHQDNSKLYRYKMN